MIYHVRWRPLKDEREQNSRDHPSISEAKDFACAILDQTAVFDISIVDGSGHQVIRMPEIARCTAARRRRATDGNDSTIAGGLRPRARNRHRYAMGARLEYILQPIAFGFGTAMVAMVGTNWGARQYRRARAIAWTGAATVALLRGTIGSTVAIHPALESAG